MAGAPHLPLMISFSASKVIHPSTVLRKGVDCEQQVMLLQHTSSSMHLTQSCQHQQYLICLSAAAVSLRMQVDPQSTEFKTLLLERAYADVLLCGCLLFLIVWNFMG